MSEILPFDSLKVGAHRYKVIFPYRFQEGVYQAFADHHLNEIRVSGVDGGCKRSTTAILADFVHEVIHCVDNVFNGRALNNSPDSERTVECLAQGLTQVLLDNPRFIGMLMEISRDVDPGLYEREVVAKTEPTINVNGFILPVKEYVSEES